MVFTNAKRVLVAGALVAFTPVLMAADFNVKVADLESRVADHAVISLKPLFDHKMPRLKNAKAIMKQEDTLFKPFVLAIRTGTAVSFPNLDAFRHHVYSFSKTQKIDIRLYGRDEDKQVLFDKAGVVALGCNIHDNMLSYIHITDDPYYSLTDAKGMASFSGVVAGKYEMTVWHPDQKSRTKTHKQEITILDGKTSLNVALKMRSRRRRQEEPGGFEYN